MSSDYDFLNMATDAIKAGASGLSVGHNVFQPPRRKALLKALRSIVHGNKTTEPWPYWNGHRKLFATDTGEGTLWALQQQGQVVLLPGLPAIPLGAKTALPSTLHTARILTFNSSFVRLILRERTLF